MTFNLWACACIVVVVVLTFYLGYYGSRTANTTRDFLVARRRVSANQNAAAISGEFLSAASFLGIAGLVLKEGPDQLWYAIGFTAGYFALLLFVAAPLRRSGAYTLPDFVEARLGSKGLRGVAAIVTVAIGYIYLIPQLQGAGLTLATVVPGTPEWAGIVLVTVVVIVNVLSGGMRAITLVQAFQYWVKVFAITAPAFVLFTVFVVGGPPEGQHDLTSTKIPVFTADTTVTLDDSVRIRVVEPIRLEVNGVVDGMPANGKAIWLSGVKDVSAHTRLSFPAGATVPMVEGATVHNSDWLRPQSGGRSALFNTYSLIFATFLGILGLPHILARFYTNPDGRSARRTTLHVLLLLGAFYLFPALLGALARLYEPGLLVTGRTDTALLLLPQAMLPNVFGQMIGALAAAGAFAAFMSTSSGLLVSLAGVVSTDVSRGRVRDFRWSTLLVMVVPVAAALGLRSHDVSLGVGMALAMAASTFCPLLILGIWWRGLTWIGAGAGMVVGGVCVACAMITDIVSGYTGDWAPALLQQPALVTVPLAFGTMIIVSKATHRRRPEEVNRIMLRLHAPDPLGFIKDRDVLRFGEGQSDGRHRRLAIRSRLRARRS
ncbi:cation acetate symporter [Kutzneria viridogrisea]|uniref:Na+/solute symporter n=2 Tax=Kutzneria TaxID=43356 RepID=W5VYU3_9PSEU|nr:cation acetate symporter [Kutzneria albida]AHH93476.1 Na+/solute symporter [Kutzneria albida DSM 43870]MBA8929138.1 Na+(H+)/acetate symporter ActP [Kutzneria viridogrisea]